MQLCSFVKRQKMTLSANTCILYGFGAKSQFNFGLTELIEYYVNPAPALAIETNGQIAKHFGTVRTYTDSTFTSMALGFYTI